MSNLKHTADPVYRFTFISRKVYPLIDHPLFQRLRDISQTGNATHVYPGANHTRFEHSLGVAHKSREWSTIIHQKQPSRMTKRDVKINETAGLLHDIGHGPFSHAFEHMFIPRCKKANELKDWDHEKQSVAIFNFMCQDSEFQEDMDCIIDFTPNEIRRIEEIVSQEDQYSLVSHKVMGGADRLDYLDRDTIHMGWRSQIESDFICNNSRINEKGEICFYKNTLNAFSDMFNLRRSLFHQVYQHNTTIAVDIMVMDALVSIDGCEGYEISDWVSDIGNYVKVTESLLWDIRKSQSDCTKKAREIVKRIGSRNFYKCVGEIIILDKCDEEKLKKLNAVELACYEDGITHDDIRIEYKKADYGHGNKNPLKLIKFYDSIDEPYYPSKARIDFHSPKVIMMKTICIYSVDPKKHTKVHNALKAWVHKMRMCDQLM